MQSVSNQKMYGGRAVGRPSIFMGKIFQKCPFPSANCKNMVGSLKCRTCKDDPEASQVCRRVLPFGLPKFTKLTKRRVCMPVNQKKTTIISRRTNFRNFKNNSARFRKFRGPGKLDKNRLKNKASRISKLNEVFDAASSSKSITPKKVKSTQKTSSTISKEMKSVADTVKKLQMEVDTLKKKDCGFRSLVASIESNTMGDYNNSKLKAAVRMVFLEEENQELKKEINQFAGELDESVLKVKKREEALKKKKAKLLADITGLKQSINEQVKLKEEKHAEHVEMRDSLYTSAKPIVNVWEYYRQKSKNDKLKSEIEFYDPTPPPPKQNPYTTEQHLEKHKFKEFEEKMYDRDASRYRIKFQKAEKLSDKLDTCQKDRKKEKFILSAVLNKLTLVHGDVSHSFTHSSIDISELEKMKERADTAERTATMKAKKDYEAIERAELERASISSNPPVVPARQPILSQVRHYFSRQNGPPAGHSFPVMPSQSHQILWAPRGPPGGPAIPVMPNPVQEVSLRRSGPFEGHALPVMPKRVPIFWRRRGPPELPALPAISVMPNQEVLRQSDPPEVLAIPAMIVEPLRPSNPPEVPAIPAMNVEPLRPSNPTEVPAIPAMIVEPLRPSDSLQGPSRPSDPQEESSNGAQGNNLSLPILGQDVHFID